MTTSFSNNVLHHGVGWSGADLLTMCWRTGYIPDVWKIALILPTHNKGSRMGSVNYRVISLLENQKT